MISFTRKNFHSDHPIDCMSVEEKVKLLAWLETHRPCDHKLSSSLWRGRNQRKNHMKKLLAVAVSVMLFVAASQATRTPQYRAVIQALPETCWAGGTCYPNGICGGWSAINTNTTCYVYPGTVCNGYIIVDIYPTAPCCGQGIIFAMTWAEVTYDSGAHWQTVADTDRALVMPGGSEAEFDVNASGVMDGGHVRVNCLH